MKFEPVVAGCQSDLKARCAGPAIDGIVYTEYVRMKFDENLAGVYTEEIFNG